jgi:hypothetical protein
MKVDLIYNEGLNKFEPEYPFSGGRNPLVSESGTQTLTNKTLTAPTITGAAGIADTITTDNADAAVPITGGTVVFTKGSSSTHTLAASAVLGTTLTLAAGSAQAHVITATGLIDDGITGGSKTTITLASFIGANIVLKAVQVGKWMVISKNAVTSVA